MLDHEKGRSLMWSLSQIRPMLEAQELERINARLDELGQVAEGRYGQLGSGPLRLPNWRAVLTRCLPDLILGAAPNA